ncbi:Protein jagunal [Melia azedarach]|uniref:Protein jagunal n=1 Tax=Melia azedarach TaxID=155640 RepID=A0ACC1X433_MELAZ|nr:Protein jagunal [Melia azedarach]
MQQRRASASSGRPSGTDGSDFSYRMVVDSRYTKVAKGKSRLSALFLSQAVVQLIGLLFTFLLTSKEEHSNRLTISSASLGLVSLIIGELGRKHSWVSLLRVCMVASSIAIFLSVFCVIKNSTMLEVINNPSNWKAKKFELLETGRVLLGSLVQMSLIGTITSLIGNMSPPKKAS